MSHIHDGPLATYNSLTDKNLSGYFSNSRMRKHLRKSGLVNRRGVIVSENQYRLNMARKEHKKHVKELLAQAIVHKTLDLERTRQVEIRRKLEEIAKIELVRRVRTTRGRKGDEEILPYLSPRPSRPSSRPATATEHRYRPRSAPSRDQYEGDTEIVYVDDRGRRLSPSPSHREVERPSKGRPEEIDTKHLYALDTTALRKYALHLSRIEQGEGSVSPYLQSPVPTPPRSARSSRTGTASLRIRQRPRTAETRDTSPYGDRKHGEVQSSAGSSRNSTPRGTPQGTPRSRRQQQRVVEGTLMLHRQEPAMMHQGEVQTLCEITMKYHGPNLTLPRDQHDPCQNINIDQQHCGGNTLPVFKEALKPGDTFSFVSRRHRGYPFSLSIFVDGRIDSRVSTCCEYRHAKGVKLGGKMGHFSLLKVTGATPCYKCKLISQATPRSLRRPPSTKSKGKPEELKEDVIVVDRKQIQDINDDDKYESDSFEESDGEDDKKAGRDEKRDKKSSSSSSSLKSSSRSSSRSSHSDSDEEKFDRNAVKHIVYEDKKKDNKRQIIGMQADGDRERESLRSKDTDSVTDVNVPGRKIDGYSDDEEYPDGPKYRSDEPYSMATKVTPEIEKPQERGRGLEPRKRDDSASSRSRSSSSSRSRSRSPVQEKRKSPSPVYDRRLPSPVYGKRSPSPVRSPSPKERKSPSPRSVSPVLRRSPSPERKRRGSVSSRSSTSSVHISDSEEEKELPKVKVEEIPKRRSSSSSSSSSSDDERRRKRKEEDVGRTPSPFPEAFSYTSYKEELSAKEKREEELRASPLPGPYRYQKMYEDSDNEITQTIEVQAEPLPEPASYQKLFETSEKETVASMSRDRKSSSSSSSGSVSSTGKGKVVTATIEPVKRASPVKSSSSSSSDSSSESEPEKKKPEPTKVTESPKKTEPVKSSSSSSSDSSTESEQGKKEAAQTRIAEPVKAAELPKTESAKKSASRSSDSSSFSSSSESDSEDENKKKTSDAAKPPLPKPPSPKLEVQTKETSQTEKKSAKSESDSSGSSDSSSDSDSDSEEDTDRKPKQGVTTPAPEVKETKVPTPPTEPKAPEKKQDSSDSSSGSESDTESSETETDRSKEAKVKSKEAVDGPRTQQLATVTTEHVEKKQTQSEQPARLQQEVKKDASDSDSDTSSSDSSDTEEENEKKIADKKSKQQRAKDSDSDNESKKIISMVTSESEAEQKKVSIFASESDGENMHGGNDPDKVADDTAKPGSFMSRIGGVKPAAAHPGPLLPVFDGKKDLEVTNIKLDNAQVTEIAGYVEKKDHVKTFCLRNASLDDDKFDGIASALINSKSEIKMVNLNLNNLKTSSADKLVEVLVEKPSVDILLLHGNPLGDDGVKKLVDGLLDLHEASQSHKEESDTSLDYCRLQELDLGDTSIQDDGIGHIARLLETDTSLQTLNLNGNPRITINGWKKLGRALKKNTNLTTLTLDFNKIGDDGLSALISGLKDNQTLKTLDLEDTSLTQDGGRKLVELLKCNTTILDITVSPGNSIPEKLRDEIRNYLGLNQAAAQPSRFKN